jgi:hypothetical protein
MRRKTRIGPSWPVGLLVLLSLLLAACGGGGQLQPDLTLSDPTSNPFSVKAGGTATFQVTLTSQNGFQGQVTLSLADGQTPCPRAWPSPLPAPLPSAFRPGGA